MITIKTPAPFLEVRVSDSSQNPSLLAMCAGYENNKWRSRQFAAHLVEWLPEYCLKYSEIIEIGSHNLVRMLKNAASNIYDSKKYENRGEIGEIILHAIIRQEFGSMPLISKIYFKDSPNETVKGFDCVHIVQTNSKIELWLGEAKFYKDFQQASREVCNELIVHTENDYLRKEFIAICNKLDMEHFASNYILKLLDRNTSLDNIFPYIVFPVLITYESNTINSYNSICKEMEESIKQEVSKHYKYFTDKLPPLKSTIHLILVPMGLKDELTSAFDNEIRGLKW